MEDSIIYQEDNLEVYIRRFLFTVQQELEEEGNKTPAFTVLIARRIAAGELLYDTALLNKIPRMMLALLGDTVRTLQGRFESSSLGVYEQKTLLTLFRNLIRAAADQNSSKQKRAITLLPSLKQLLRDVGTHSGDIPQYIHAVLHASEGKGSPFMREWLPGGGEFEEIQRQRARWGYEPFSYSTEQELDPLIAFEILNYYLEYKSLSQEDAFAEMQLFIERSF